MRNDSVSKWIKAIREVAVIVVGVLVALGADAFWQGQQDEAAARYYLESIQGEVRKGIAQVESTSAQVDSLMTRTGTLLEAVSSGGPISDDVESMADNNFPMRVPLGTLEALFDTGDQRLIEDRVLRTLLVTERAELGSMQELLDQWTYAGIRRFMERIEHATRRRLELGQIVPGEWTPVAPDMIGMDPSLIVSYAQALDAFDLQLQVMGLLRESLIRVDEAVTVALQP